MMKTFKLEIMIFIRFFPDYKGKNKMHLNFQRTVLILYRRIVNMIHTKLGQWDGKLFTLHRNERKWVQLKIALIFQTGLRSQQHFYLLSLHKNDIKV